MFLPLHDQNPIRHVDVPYVTYGLIAANVLVFLFQLSHQPASAFNEFAITFSAISPAAWTGTPIDRLPGLPDELTLVTYAFFHADWMHLLSNMLFLWVFGDNVEDALGHVKFLIFYLACAVGGAWLHGVILPDSEAPLIGASGAIAGIVAAYLILHPRVKLWVLVLMRIPLRIPAWIPLALWIAFQFLMLTVQTEDQVSWPCHVGGIITGAVLVLFLRRRGVPLFDRDLDTAALAPAAATPAPAAPPAKWGRPD